MSARFLPGTTSTTADPKTAQQNTAISTLTNPATGLVFPEHWGHQLTPNGTEIDRQDLLMPSTLDDPTATMYLAGTAPNGHFLLVLGDTDSTGKAGAVQYVKCDAPTEASEKVRAAFQTPADRVFLAPNAPVEIPTPSEAPRVPPMPFAASDGHPIDALPPGTVLDTMNTSGTVTAPGGGISVAASLPHGAVVTRVSATETRINFTHSTLGKLEFVGTSFLHALSKAWAWIEHPKL
jgi:hypothetical protein